MNRIGSGVERVWGLSCRVSYFKIGGLVAIQSCRMVFIVQRLSMRGVGQRDQNLGLMGSRACC